MPAAPAEPSKWPSGDGETAWRIRTLNWAATPLGPVEGWPGRLKVMVEVVLASPLVSSLVCGPERVLIYNDAAARFHGARHPAALGQPLPQAFPERWAVAAPFYARAFAGEAVQAVAEPSDAGEGEACAALDVALTPVRDDAGSVAFVQMTGQDAGPRIRLQAALHRSRDREAFLLQLSDALRPLGDPAAVQRTAARLLGEQLGANRVAYKEVEGGEFVVRDDWTRGVASVAGRRPLAVLGEEQVARGLRGESWTVDDVLAEPGLLPVRATYAALAIRAFVTVPLIKDGRWVGALMVHGKAPRRWTEAEAGLVAEVAERTWSMLEQVRAEAALRASEEHYRASVELNPQIPWTADARGRVTGASSRWTELTGMAVADALNDGWMRAPHPDDLPGMAAAWRRAVATGEPYDVEVRVLRPDGGHRWTRMRASPRREKQGAPRRDKQGRVVQWYGTVEDVHDRKLAEAALRESEARFAQFAASSSDCLWIRDARTLAMEYASPAARSIYGTAPDALAGDLERWLALIVPNDRAAALAHLEQARCGEAAALEFRIQRPSDGAFRWIRNTGFPLRDEAGRVQRIGGIATDITEAKQGAEHQAVLLAELQHRVRNIMAVIRAIAVRTGRTAGSVEEYAARMAGRLTALERVQALLTREANAGVPVAAIVEDELRAQAGHEDQYALSGPDLVLPPKAAEVLTLAAHELTTNALKHGALSVPQGRVRVAWQVFEEAGVPWLRFQWTEQGAPTPAASEPRRRGFGTELIEKRIPYELDGRASVAMEAGGAQCRLEFPLRGGGSILNTDAPRRAAVPGGSLGAAAADLRESP